MGKRDEGLSTAALRAALAALRRCFWDFAGRRGSVSVTQWGKGAM